MSRLLNIANIEKESTSFTILRLAKASYDIFKCCRANDSPSENIDKDRIRQNTDKIIVNGLDVTLYMKSNKCSSQNGTMTVRWFGNAIDV